MVQIKVTTALQEDYIPDQPCQVMRPVPLTSRGQCNPPVFDTVNDAQGKLNIFWLSQGEDQAHRALYNVYYDELQKSWVQEDTGWSPMDTPVLHTGFLKVALHPSRGTIHVAMSHSVNTDQGTATAYLYYLELVGRYPKWQTALIGQGTWSFDCLSLDMAFESGDTPIVCYTRADLESPAWGWGGSGPYIWTPNGSTGIQHPSVSSNVVGPRLGTPMMTWDLSYGKSPDWTWQSSHDADWRFYQTFHYVDPDNDYIERIPVEGFGLPGFATVPAISGRPYQTTLKVIYLEDPGTSPLLFGIRTYLDNNETSVLFFPNDNYSFPPNQSPPVQLFADVSGKAVSLDAGLRAVADATDEDVGFEINVFCIFEIYNGDTLASVEVWHTETLKGAITREEGGIFTTTAASWSNSSKVTDNVFSSLQNPYLRPPIGPLSLIRSVNSYGLSVVTGVGDTVCTVLGQDLTFQVWNQEADGKWISDVISSSTSTSTGIKTTCCAVDIAAVDDQGVPLPYATGKFGTSISTLVNINGSSIALQPDQEIDISFNVGGRCGLSVETYGSIIPDTYTLWVEGMEDDARIDIQPAAQDLHDTLQGCTADDMKKIAGSGVGQSDLTNAAESLQKLSTVITGPPDLLGHISSEYVHPKTSPHVARSRRQLSTANRLGRLPVGYEFAFHISFKNGLSCTTLTRTEASKLVEEFSSLGFLGIDWGDVWDNVENAVYSVTDIIVDVGTTAVRAVISGLDLLKNKLQWAWDGLVSYATEIADMASAVFDYIKSTWDLIVQWLGFFFDWHDIQLTAQRFTEVVHQTDTALLSFIDNTLQPLTTAFFDTVEQDLNGWITQAGTTYGSQTAGQYANISLKTQLDSFDPVAILDALPSPGLWFMNKLLGIIESFFDGITIIGADDSGIDDFITSMNGILDQLISKQNGDSDFQAAIQSVENLVTSITTNGIFDSTTFGSLMTAIQALALICVDMAETVVQLAIDVGRYLATKFVAFVEDPISLPGISWLYEQITGSSLPSVSEVICFALAIPFTIIFKVMYGVAPFTSTEDPGAVMQTQSMGTDQFLHATHGVIKVLNAGLGLVVDISRLRKTSSNGSNKAQCVWKCLTCQDLSDSAVSMRQVLVSPTDSGPDYESKVMGFIGLLVTAMRVAGAIVDTNWGRRTMSRLEANVQNWCMGVEGLVGVGTTICAIYEASNGPTTDHDKIATAQLFLNGMAGITNIFKMNVFSPQVVLVAGLVSFVGNFGVAACDFSMAAIPPTLETAKPCPTDSDQVEEL